MTLIKGKTPPTIKNRVLMKDETPVKTPINTWTLIKGNEGQSSEGFGVILGGFWVISGPFWGVFVSFRGVPATFEAGDEILHFGVVQEKLQKNREKNPTTSEPSGTGNGGCPPLPRRPRRCRCRYLPLMVDVVEILADPRLRALALPVSAPRPRCPVGRGQEAQPKRRRQPHRRH